MRRINVKAYEKALVARNGKLEKVLGEGKHWIGMRSEVKYFDITKMFYHDGEMDLLLKNETFSSMLQAITVMDNEIMLQFKNGLFNGILNPGRYFYWKEGLDYTYERIDLNAYEISDSIDRKILRKVALSKYCSVYNVESYEKGILYVDGKMVKTLEPGTYFYWNGEKTALVKKVDVRKQQIEISGQELLTKDKAGIRANFYASYQVVDVEKAIDQTKDFARMVYIIIQLGIREYVGLYTLDNLLANKESAGSYILSFASEKIADMGVKLIDCGLRDIILPGDMRNIMNQVLIAEKKAQAQVIMRREETASTRSLLNTAKLMEDNEMLFRLKEMEYIEKISEKVGEITLNGGNQIMDQLRGIASGKS